MIWRTFVENFATNKQVHESYRVGVWMTHICVVPHPVHLNVWRIYASFSNEGVNYSLWPMSCTSAVHLHYHGCHRLPDFWPVYIAIHFSHLHVHLTSSSMYFLAFCALLHTLCFHSCLLICLQLLFILLAYFYMCLAWSQGPYHRTSQKNTREQKYLAHYKAAVGWWCNWCWRRINTEAKHQQHPLHSGIIICRIVGDKKSWRCTLLTKAEMWFLML